MGALQKPCSPREPDGAVSQVSRPGDRPSTRLVGLSFTGRLCEILGSVWHMPVGRDTLMATLRLCHERSCAMRLLDIRWAAVLILLVTGVLPRAAAEET